MDDQKILIPPLEPAQGIMAALEKLFIWNPAVAQNLITQINNALESAEQDAAAAQSSAAAAARCESNMEAAIQQMQDYVATQAQSFVFEMSEERANWTIVHNLDKYPSVTVVDTAGTEIEVDVKYIDSNTVELHANAPFKGKAYLNYGGITDVMGREYDMGTIN